MARKPVQNFGRGYAIRDDGTLCYATPKILAQSNYRPYTGDPKATLEQRKRWLAGLSTGRRPVVGVATQEQALDLRICSKEELLEYMETDWAITLDARRDVEELRKQVITHVEKETAAEKQRAEDALAMMQGANEYRAKGGVDTDLVDAGAVREEQRLSAEEKRAMQKDATELVPNSDIEAMMQRSAAKAAAANAAAAAKKGGIRA